MNKRRKRTNKNVPAIGRLRDIADDLWSHAVRDDWGWCCVKCRKQPCEAHHLIPREHEATRYEMKNGIALCSHHHKFDPEISPHQNAAGWLAWLTDHFPEVAVWYIGTIETFDHWKFKGTKNAQHYMGVINGLREYVEPDEFVRIVGVRFSDYLKAQE